jgi:hypothetical protein
MKQSRILLRPLLITAGILMIPLFGNLFVEGWNWPWTAFAFPGAVLFGAGVAYELAGKTARVGVTLGFAFGLLFAVGGIFTLKYLNPAEDVAGIVIYSLLLSGLFFAAVGFVIQKYFRKQKAGREG